MNLVRTWGLLGFLLLLGAASCSRTPVDPVKEDPDPVKPDTPKTNSVLDTGWRQTGYRIPEMPTIGYMQRAGNVLVTADSADRVWVYRRATGWGVMPMPKEYRRRTYFSILGVGDTVYFGSLSYQGYTWDTSTDSLQAWTIPGVIKPGDTLWINAFGTYRGDLVAAVRVYSWTNPSEVWIRMNGQWRPFGTVKKMTDGVFDVFYEASDGTLFAGSDKGLFFLNEVDSVWTKVSPLDNCKEASCGYVTATGITEYDGVGWVTSYGPHVRLFDVASRKFIDTVSSYRVVADSVYKLYRFGSFYGLLRHGDYLFIAGFESAPGVWVWNRKRKWFQHVPLLRKGVTYYTNNYASTYGLAVMDDTLYASNSHGIVKFALADIAADLARDTLPWPGTP